MSVKIMTVILSLLLVSAAAGQNPGNNAAGVPQSPTEISRHYFELMKAGQWKEVAALYDARALSEFRGMMSFMYDLPVETVTPLMQNLIGGGISIDSLKKINDVDYWGVLLAGLMAQAAKAGQLDFQKLDIIGSIPEGEEVVHVLARVTMAVGETSLEAMEVISFRKSGDKWGILLSGKFRGLAEQIKRALVPKR